MLLGAVVATVVAFRAILVAPFGLGNAADIEYWLFIPDRDSVALAVLLGLWLLWNRRERLTSAESSTSASFAWSSAMFVLVVFAWAVWSGAQTLLIPTLCLHIAFLAHAWGGWRAVRAMAAPCLALLLAVPPPDPLLSEIIWHLQGWTATASHWLLTLFGLPVLQEGTELHVGEYAFVVIEACSGWRSIQILMLVGLAAAELRHLPFLRALFMIVLAIPIAIALNIVRVSLVVLTKQAFDAAVFENHTPQGVAVLMVGSVLLYGVAASLQRKPEREGSRGSSIGGGVRAARRPLRRVGPALGLSIALSLVSLVLPSLKPERREGPGRLGRSQEEALLFPKQGLTWAGTILDKDYFFPYSTVSHPQFHVAYKQPERWGGYVLVDLFIAREIPKPSGLNRLPGAKLLLPANDWTLVSREPARIWRLGVEGERAIVSRKEGAEMAYVIAWRLHDDGLIWESLQALLGLRADGPFGDGHFPTVVRLTVPILHDDGPGRERARLTANRFIRDFENAFDALALQ